MRNVIELAGPMSRLVPFTPKKSGDVGHDIHTVIGRDHMTILDKIVSLFVGRDCIVVMPHSERIINSGLHLGLHDGVWAWIVARSSTSRKRMIVLGGVLDSGYRGELYTVLGNFGWLPRIVKHDERYAQVIFFNAVRPEIRRVHELLPTDRGATGFGSSGA
jgi:dUTP pyrophosphatase